MSLFEYYSTWCCFCCSDKVLIRVEVIVVVVAHGVPNNVININTIPQETSNSTESLHKLEAIRRLVCDELNVDAVFFVVETEPVGKLLAVDNLTICACLRVLEVLRVLLLRSVKQEGLGLILYGVLDLISHNLNVLKQHHRLKRTELESFHGVLHTESDHSGIECNLLKEFANDFLFLHEFDILQRVLCQRDRLIETLIKAVGHVDRRDDQILQPVVKVIALLHHEFQVSATGNDDTANVWPVIGNKVLSCQLATFDNVEMALLLSETRETNGRLTTATMLFRQLDRHSLDDLLVVSLEGRE